MLKDKVTEIFVEVDDFCKEFEVEIRKHLIESKNTDCRIRKSQLSGSEIISILLLFHYGQFTNFKAFYTQYVCAHLIDLFPDLVSYQRFVALKKKVAVPLMMFLKTKGLGKCRALVLLILHTLRYAIIAGFINIKHSKRLLKEDFALSDGSLVSNFI